MESQTNKVEEKVMGQITSGRIKLRSKYIFLAEKLGLGSALALSVLLAVLFFSLILFYLKASDNLIYLSFGSRGLFAFLESFPYLLVASFIVLVFIAGFTLKKSGIFYKKPFGGLAVGLVVIILAIGAALALTSIAERIEKETYGQHSAGRFFGPFFHHGLENRQRGISGRVTEIGDNYIMVQTPFETKKIDLKNVAPLPEKISAGDFVMAIGDNKGNFFEASDIRVANPDDIQMIRRGVHERFGTFTPPMPGGPMPPPTGTGSMPYPCDHDACGGAPQVPTSAGGADIFVPNQ